MDETAREERLLPKAALSNAELALSPRAKAEQELLKAKEDLQKQSEWLQITLSSIGDGVIVTDAHRQVTFLNRAAETLTGWSSAEAIGSPLEAVFPIVNERMETRVAEFTIGGGEKKTHGGFGGPNLLVARNGSLRAIEESASVLHGPGQEVIGTVLIFRDVSKRLQAEARLKDSEAQHRFLENLGQATQSMTHPDDIKALTAQKLADHLGASRCAYAEVEDESTLVITKDHCSGVNSLVGRWPVRAFGADCQRLLLANAAFVIDDVEINPRIGEINLAAYRAASIQAVICVPLQKAGKLDACMLVHQNEPRRWSTAEVQLVMTVVHRCWDALEKARMTLSLKESEERLRNLADNLPSGFIYQMLIGDHDSRQFTYMSRGVEALCGLTQAEVAADPARLLHLIAREDWPLVRAMERSARQIQGLFDCQFRLHIGERVRWLHCRAAPRQLIDGKQIWDGIALDVTERKRAEEALARLTFESEKRRRLYETILSNTPDLVYVFGLNHRFTYANEALLNLLGKSFEEVIGKNPLELGYEPWHAAMHDREIEQVIATKMPIRGEVPFTGIHGPRIHDYIFVPVIGAHGEVEAVGGTTRDITERKLAEEELKAADRKKNEFLALLAHELRNPLAPLRNGLQILKLATEENKTSAEARVMMERQLGHMVRLIDDLLDISRISQHKMELRRARVLLAEVVASAVETVRPAIQSGQHHLTVSLPPEAIPLDADLTRLAQVFSNLLSNSAKYTARGGQIALTARRHDGEVVVTVHDNGIGIPASSLPGIFDMFSQVDRSIERSTGGLGIGLALVRGLTEMHGGTVEAASTGEGKGSTFTVRLPILHEAAPGGSEAQKGEEKRGEQTLRRILVADDNRDSASSMAMMLKLRGNDVRTAHDGLEAMKVAESFKPQAILMDVGMPRCNGYDATRHIRSQIWGRDMIVIAVTGWGQEIDRIKSKDAGCDGHLVKPIHLSHLEQLLTELTEARSRPATRAS